MTLAARGLFTAVLSWVLLTGAASASPEPLPAPGQFQGRPIVEIELRGPTAPDRATFEERTRLRTGRTYSAAAIRLAVTELFDAGDWIDIQVGVNSRDGGVALTVTFEPRIRIRRVEFRGHHQKTEALERAADLRAGDEFTEHAVAAAVERVRNWYHQLAYVVDINARVELEASETRARVTFEITERDRLRIRTISFPGTPAFSRLRHLFALRTAPGEYFSSEHIERGLVRLRRLYRDAGYLDASIGPQEWTLTPRGVTLSIPIQQGTRYRFDFSGHLGVDEDALLAQMTIPDDPRDDEDTLAEEAERLASFLVDRGYRRASVRVERRLDTDGTVIIEITVDAGQRFPLAEVTVTGNIAASDRELTDILATRPGGWLWWTRYAQQDVMEDDRKRIQAWYRARGFLSTSVTAQVVEADDPPGAAAVFAVEEGPQTRVGQVEIAGPQSVPLDAVLARYGIEEGSPYVEAQVRAARASMLETYSERGYIYATIEVTPSISADRTRADIRFRVTEGPSVTVGEITLVGNEQTQDHVILRELDVRSGDVYNPRRIFDNQRRVAQLGFLREVRLEPRNPERQESVKDLRLSVKERNAGSVDLGIGYANFEGMRGFGEITYRNLFGLGRRGGIRLEGSRIERKAILSYRHPWLFDYRLDGKATLFHEVREEETRGYQRSTYGASTGVDRNLSPRLFGSLVYDYQINHLEALDPSTVLPFDRNRANIASLTPSLVWDTRDDPFNPRRGLVVTAAFESASLLLGSQEQYWKATTGVSGFMPVLRPVVLALSARGGVANRFGETREALGNNPVDLLLPVTERFYVGGRSSIRGYEEDTVGFIQDGTPTGGNILLVLNAEVRVALPASFGLVFFWDGGNVWLDQPDVRWTDIRTTTGIGLRYNTPVGPLRLDYGHKLNWEPGESHGTFHFTLGHAF